MSRKLGVPVLVTGFGPFGRHKVNISWEIAKLLKTLNVESQGIDLIIEEIPVVYYVVSKKVPALWKEYNPKVRGVLIYVLVIHMGVNGLRSEITMELLAHKSGYTKVDTLGKLPEKGSANGVKEVIATTLNLQDICDCINNSAEHEVPLSISTNAGRYLCEFTYYNSLTVDNSKVVFVHVPDFDKGYTTMQMAIIIKEIMLLLLKQITNSSDEYLEEQNETENTEIAQSSIKIT